MFDVQASGKTRKIASEILARFIVEVQRVLKCKKFRASVALNTADGLPIQLKDVMYLLQSGNDFIFCAYGINNAKGTSMVSVNNNVPITSKACTT